MLRDGAHVREEDLDVVILLRLVVLRAAAQCLKTLAPAVRCDRRDRLCRALAVRDRSHQLRDRRARKRRLDALIHGAVRLECRKSLVAVLRVDVGEICLDILRALCLECRRILRTRFEQNLCHVRVHIVADNTVFADVRLLEAVGENLCDLVLHRAGAECRNDAALLFDALELCPDLFLHLARQRLNCPRAARRIDRLEHTELLLQHDLDVACNAA